MNKRIIGALAAMAIVIGTGTAVSAKGLPYPYNSKAANLQAMQWYGQQTGAYGYGGGYGGYGGYGYNGYNQFTNPYNYGAGYGNPYYNNNYNRYGNGWRSWF